MTWQVWLTDSVTVKVSPMDQTGTLNAIIYLIATAGFEDTSETKALSIKKDGDTGNLTVNLPLARP